MRGFPFLLLGLAGWALCQEPAAEAVPVEQGEAARGSIVEDRAARKLVEAGDLRLAAGEEVKAVEIWESCIERYPKSRVRFEAHARLGEFFLTKKRAYDEARLHFESAAAEENPDDLQRAAALLKTGVCYYEARNYGASFKRMREVIETYPASPQLNDAYFYIGLGHFKLGHFSRAIESLEKVGAGFSKDDTNRAKVEAGRRLYIKVEDADLSILGPEESLRVVVKSSTGDEETVECRPLGRRVRVAAGSIITALGKPEKGNQRLEVTGGGSVSVIYVDEHTADAKSAQPRTHEIKVVGDAQATFMDGSFRESTPNALIGKSISIQVADADGDVTDAADTVKAKLEIWRGKTREEMETELAALQATAEPGAEKPKVELLQLIGSREVTLTELSETSDSHTGLFRASLPLGGAPGAETIEARSGDTLRLLYQDAVNTSSAAREVLTEARCVDGHLGEVNVARTQIFDEELRLQTKLRTGGALTHVGNFYKEFGIDDKAQQKYQEALEVCEEAASEARKRGGPVLEESYVQLWRIYFAMEQLDAAANVSERLQREFPNSIFIDEAVMQQAAVARKKQDFTRALALFSGVLRLPKSPMRGEAQYAIGECYEEMAAAAPKEQSPELYEKSFQAYQAIYEKFPDHPRVGDAVAKMANFYYQNKDYARAVEVFETVLKEHPDANFLDVILFNYGRCLFRLEKKGEARKEFDTLIQEFPDSPLAPEARKISETLVKAGY